MTSTLTNGRRRLCAYACRWRSATLHSIDLSTQQHAARSRHNTVKCSVLSLSLSMQDRQRAIFYSYALTRKQHEGGVTYPVPKGRLEARPFHVSPAGNKLRRAFEHGATQHPDIQKAVNFLNEYRHAGRVRNTYEGRLAERFLRLFEDLDSFTAADIPAELRGTRSL